MELEGRGGAENPVGEGGGKQRWTEYYMKNIHFQLMLKKKKKKKAEDQDVYFLLMSRDPKWYMRINTDLHINPGENKQASIHFSRSKPSRDPCFQKQQQPNPNLSWNASRDLLFPDSGKR